MQARLSVIVLVVALCAIFSASCSAELVQKEGSLRRGLEEVQVRDDFDASAQPPYEAAPIHGEVDEEAEPEGDDEDAPVEPMDDKEPTLIIDESEPYNLDDIDVPETEDPSLIEQGTEVKTGFDSEDAEALDDLAKANAQFPDGDLNEDFEQTIELDGSESDEQAIETDADAQYHEGESIK